MIQRFLGTLSTSAGGAGSVTFGGALSAGGPLNGRIAGIKFGTTSLTGGNMTFTGADSAIVYLTIAATAATASFIAPTCYLVDTAGNQATLSVSENTSFPALAGLPIAESSLVAAVAASGGASKSVAITLFIDDGK